MGIDPEEQKKLNSLAGKQAYELNKGFHAFSPLEKAVHSRKGALTNIGKFWWNNGVINKRDFQCPGISWTKGKLPCKSGPKLGTKIGKFWNNGIINKRSEESPGTGWVAGKFLNVEQRAKRSEIAKQTLRKRWNKE